MKFWVDCLLEICETKQISNLYFSNQIRVDLKSINEYKSSLCNIKTYRFLIYKLIYKQWSLYITCIN